MPSESSSQQLQRRFGSVLDWIVEWQVSGIRAQIIRRGARTFVWTIDGELVTDRFPEVVNATEFLPDGTALDGNLIARKSGLAIPLSELQKRLSRKSVSRKLLTDVPVQFVAFDLLEEHGADIRRRPLRERLTRLESLLATQPADRENRLAAAERPTISSWEACCDLHSTCRENSAEGLILKRADSEYEVGDQNENWWHWKAELIHCNAILLYAQRASAGRAGKFTDYTFAVWNGEELVPFTKAPASMSESETAEINQFIRANTLERFGPVCSVKPELVFEVSFEGTHESIRHKAGFTVRSPQIVRWQKNMKADEADSLATLRSFMGAGDCSHPGVE